MSIPLSFAVLFIVIAFLFGCVAGLMSQSTRMSALQTEVEQLRWQARTAQQNSRAGSVGAAVFTFIAILFVTMLAIGFVLP